MAKYYFAVGNYNDTCRYVDLANVSDNSLESLSKRGALLFAEALTCKGNVLFDYLRPFYFLISSICILLKSIFDRKRRHLFLGFSVYIFGSLVTHEWICNIWIFTITSMINSEFLSFAIVKFQLVDTQITLLKTAF